MLLLYPVLLENKFQIGAAVKSVYITNTLPINGFDSGLIYRLVGLVPDPLQITEYYDYPAPRLACPQLNVNPYLLVPVPITN